jgi:hypothetical protein
MVVRIRRWSAVGGGWSAVGGRLLFAEPGSSRLFALGKEERREQRIDMPND